MKRLLIYPALYEHREIIKYNYMIKNYKLVGAITANDYSYKIEEIQKEFPDIKLSSDFESEVSNCDSVLFLDGMDEDQIQLYCEKIRYSVLQGKEILVTQELNDLMQRHNQVLEGIKLLVSNNCYKINNEEIKEYLKPIDVPTIGVMGLGEFCGKFSFELEIKNFFKEYNVLQYGSKNISTLFGIQELPKFIFNPSLSVTKRIILLNDFLFKQCEEHKPDLLIIGIKEAIIPINRKILNDFGEIPFIISQAVINFDIGVLGIHYNEGISAEFFTEYRNCCKYKYNSIVDYFNISNTAFRFGSDESHIEYMHLDKQLIDGKIPSINENNICTFNVESNINLQTALTKIKEDLTSNPCVF